LKNARVGIVLAIRPGKVVDDIADIDFDSDEDEDGQPVEVPIPTLCIA